MLELRQGLAGTQVARGRRWAVLGMVQAVVRHTQAEVLWAPASVPRRATLWWRHNCTDPGLGFQHCHLCPLGSRAAEQPAVIYLEQVTSAQCHPVLGQGDSHLAIVRSRAWPPQPCMLLTRAGGG